jgi:hypothetical protein
VRPSDGWRNGKVRWCVHRGALQRQPRGIDGAPSGTHAGAYKRAMGELSA